ncbi:MAG: hypothetical protein ACI9VR_000732 [Cognaticolwellia sp.]|jgi:hypothetical protein
MFFLLATLACETAPQIAASAPQPTLDPSRNVAQSSMGPIVSAIIDPLMAGITFGAVNLNEISVEFGGPSSGALADVVEEELELSDRWDSIQTEDTTIGTHSKSAPPTIKKVSTGKISVGAGPEISIDAREIDAAIGKTMSISQVVRKQRGKVQYCHDTGKTRDSQVNGRITVAWTVTGGGVADIQVLDNTTGDDKMAACVARQVRSFKFPKDMEDDVSYPFVFQQG